MVRRAKGAEREQAVVGAATELLVEQGLNDLRIVDVAERAGMSVGHVTYYFPSKSDLLVRAIQQSEEAFQEHVRLMLDELDDPWRQLIALIEAAAADGPGDRGWLLWFEVWASASSDEQIAAVQRRLDAWWRSTMYEIVIRGVETGCFACEDPRRATAVLSALTDGLSVQLALGGEQLSRSLVIDLVTTTARDLLEVQ